MTFYKKIKNKPLFSVIMSVYNCELYINETIKSVIKQAYKNWELIIVDNCSTDKTVSLLNNFQSMNDNIKVYINESNSGGPAVPRNIGIQKSKGKFIAIISGHCIPKNNFWISNLLKNFTNQKIAAVYGKQEPLQTFDFNIVRE